MECGYEALIHEIDRADYLETFYKSKCLFFFSFEILIRISQKHTNFPEFPQAKNSQLFSQVSKIYEKGNASDGYYQT